MKPVRTIVWAIDAFEPLETQNGSTAAALRELGTFGALRILPVCLVTRPHGDRAHGQPAAADAASQVGEWLRSSRVPGLEPVSFVELESLTSETAAEVLVALAVEQRADLIAVSTHDRRGPSRWFLGSVSESLVHAWNVPALIVNPERTSGRGLTRVLFPTDFSASSKAALTRVLAWARHFGWKVSLFHAGEHLPVDVSLEAIRWADWAKESFNVAVDTLLDDSRRSIADAIAQAANKAGAGLIVMVSHAGPYRAALLGSVTREVVRRADCPVIAWHHK